jgi:hypothetical protein
VTFNRQTRNFAYLVFDTLYGLDTSWQAQPQMVEGHEVEEDGLTWLLRLRDGPRSTTTNRCWRRTLWQASGALQYAFRSPAP